jgi:hypothetical protein
MMVFFLFKRFGLDRFQYRSVLMGPTTVGYELCNELIMSFFFFFSRALILYNMIPRTGIEHTRFQPIIGLNVRLSRAHESLTGERTVYKNVKKKKKKRKKSKKRKKNAQETSRDFRLLAATTRGPTTRRLSCHTRR